MFDDPRSLAMPLILVVILFGPLTRGYAWTKDAPRSAYERKSVTIIDMVWLATPSARSMSSKQTDLLESAIRRRIMGKQGLGARFDHNILEKESALVERFLRKAGEDDDLMVERVAALLTETLAGPIVRILDAQKEIRARARISEVEHQKVLTIKAKELGITAVDFERIMNSAYLYLPVLTSYSRTVTSTPSEDEEDEEKGKKGKEKEQNEKIEKKQKKEQKEKTSVRYALTGEMVWFKLDVSPEGKGIVSLLTRVESRSYAADLVEIDALKGPGDARVPVPGSAIGQLIKEII
ncbi:MAG: hypothetical protein V1800_03450 [Candidatus Latescibacterota bacterium]